MFGFPDKNGWNGFSPGGLGWSITSDVWLLLYKLNQPWFFKISPVAVLSLWNSPLISVFNGV